MPAVGEFVAATGRARFAAGDKYGDGLTGIEMSPYAMRPHIVQRPFFSASFIFDA